MTDDEKARAALYSSHADAARQFQAFADKMMGPVRAVLHPDARLNLVVTMEGHPQMTVALMAHPIEVIMEGLDHIRQRGVVEHRGSEH